MHSRWNIRLSWGRWPWALGACLLTALLAGCAAPPGPPAASPASELTAQPPRARPAPAPAPKSRAAAPAVPAPPSPDAAAPAEEPAAAPDGVLLGRGLASWYGPNLHGRRTASGERFDRYEFTAAHRTLPFGARVCVRSVLTGKAVVVRINDRGPFGPDRVIDLSEAAAEELGMVGLGIKPVELWHLGPDEERCPDGWGDAEAPDGEETAAAAPRRAGGKVRAKSRGKSKPKPRARVR